MDDSQVTFDKLKLEAEYLHFEADHLLKRAAELDCITCLAQKKDKTKDAQEPYNRLRYVVTLMTPLLSTNDAKITKERAIIRRKYDQACQDIRARLMNLFQEIEFKTVPDVTTQQDSASSGISSAQQSRTVHSESGAWSLDSFDGRVTSSASESQERSGSKSGFLVPHAYGRTSGGSTTSRTSSEAIPIPGTSSGCNTPRTRRSRIGAGGGNRFNVGACLDAQPELHHCHQPPQQQQSTTSSKTGMSYGSGDTVVARSLHLLKISMSSDDEDRAPPTIAPNMDQDAIGSAVAPQSSSTALQPQQRVPDWSCHTEKAMPRLSDQQESPELSELNGERAVARLSSLQPPSVGRHSSSHNPFPDAPSRDPSSSPLLSRCASHRPVPSYSSIEQPASPVSSSPSHCDQAALLHAGQAVARPARCCGRLHCNKVVLLVVVIVIQAVIIAGLIFWKIYYP